MADSNGRHRHSRESGGLASNAVMILLIGTALGLAYNLVGLNSQPAFGLDWVARPIEDTVFVMPGEEAGRDEGGQPVEEEYHDIDNPLAIFGNAGEQAVMADLPPIPEISQPIQVQMPVAKRFFDAGAALFVDARDRQEYEEGHLPGAINLPFDIAATDPALLESLDTGGRPVIAYCGGGECETSINICWFLIEVGHTRVTYFPDGYSGWVEAGYPVVMGGEGVE